MIADMSSNDSATLNFGVIGGAVFALILTGLIVLGVVCHMFSITCANIWLTLGFLFSYVALIFSYLITIVLMVVAITSNQVCYSIDGITTAP